MTASSSTSTSPSAPLLSPWPLRLLAWLLLLAVALAAVWLVDRHAMQRQFQLIHQPLSTPSAPPSAATP